MSYAVLLHPKVVKFLRKLPKNDVSRIKTRLNDLREPYSVKAVKLSGSDAYRIRVGDYRVLYTIDDSKRVVVVFKIDKRERVYDRL